MPGPQRVVALAAILSVGGDRLFVELGFIVSGHQALIEDQADDHADREGATTEAEAIDIVGLILVVAAGEFVDVDHVPLQAEAERTTKNRPRLERRGAYAVVVECDLVISRQVQRPEGAPDICAPHLRRGIACAVGKQNNFTAHVIAPALCISPTTCSSRTLHNRSDGRRLIGEGISTILRRVKTEKPPDAPLAAALRNVDAPLGFTPQPPEGSDFVLYKAPCFWLHYADSSDGRSQVNS